MVVNKGESGGFPRAGSKWINGFLSQFPQKHFQHYLSLFWPCLLPPPPFYLQHPSFLKFQVTTLYKPHCSPLSSHTSPSLSLWHCDKGTSMSTPTVWRRIIISGHGVGQRGKVGGQGTVAIKGASSVNRFLYGRKSQSVSHQSSHQSPSLSSLSCHWMDGAHVNHTEGNEWKWNDGDGNEIQTLSPLIIPLSHTEPHIMIYNVFIADKENKCQSTSLTSGAFGYITLLFVQLFLKIWINLCSFRISWV